MGGLDGAWEVRRTGGVLPPMLGVRKEISGSSGSTKLGPLPGAPFDVAGLMLRYRPPFAGFVDVLEPEGDRYRGRSTFRGREFGAFELSRTKSRAQMASEKLQERLIKHIDQAYAMEQNVLRMLKRTIEATVDEEIKDELRQHKLETQRHADRMQQRLEAHSVTPSLVKRDRGKAGRNPRDGYATEHLEIATYQLLERVAEKAGDEETAEAARENRRDEEEMVKKLEAHWDQFAELSLE